MIVETFKHNQDIGTSDIKINTQNELIQVREETYMKYILKNISGNFVNVEFKLRKNRSWEPNKHYIVASGYMLTPDDCVLTMPEECFRDGKNRAGVKVVGYDLTLSDIDKPVNNFFKSTEYEKIYLNKNWRNKVKKIYSEDMAHCEAVSCEYSYFYNGIHAKSCDELIGLISNCQDEYTYFTRVRYLLLKAIVMQKSEDIDEIGRGK